VNPQLTAQIAGKSIFSALQLKDNSLLLGSVENGLYHVSPEGVLLEHFNQENGLQNNTVLHLYQDEDENVWAGLDNGLSILNLNSPFRIFQDHVGRIGTVYSSFQNEDFLYLGTNQGLYYRKKGAAKFNFINGTNGQVWSLQMVDNVLFCGHNSGTYVISEEIAVKVSDRLGTWAVVDYKPVEGVFVQGHYNGFSFLKQEGETFVDIPLVKDFPHSSKYIVSEENGEVWISNEHKGVFKIRMNDSLKTIHDLKNYPFSEGSGVTSSIFMFNDALYYSNINDVFRYDPATDEFLEENILSEAFKDVDRVSGRMIAMDNKVWAFGERAVISAGPSIRERGYITQSYYLPREYRSIPLGYENLTRLRENVYMLGLVDGYLLFDESFRNKKTEYRIRIDKVEKSALDEDPKTISLSGIEDLHYKNNNLSFYFSIPEYKKFLVPLYSYRLRGLTEKWSEWSSISTAGFENLPYGDYNFEVRGKMGEEILPSVSYHFAIARPWYLSNLAIAAYFLLFLLLLYVIHLVYKKEHDKRIRENEKALKMKNLEAEQKIIKLQNEQLEKEMEGKSRELAVSTMNLVKKNEFLSSIRAKLKESEGSTQVKSVIKTIDKDISEKDNWSFFEKAFNNADKEFFKKIKSRHPELTSNDLKLCAYLRLNLTSKEIAPLLNISVKSVEIKRYRLRKKMDLPHEENLVDYILGI
ncbi:MAG: triple tyrosine motif-containing protein, partial [Salinimicrobium sediminis]|nr:triple tyrosine motif-containing protein [Salinimicrobium sediminis]